MIDVSLNGLDFRKKIAIPIIFCHLVYNEVAIKNKHKTNALFLWLLNQANYLYVKFFFY